MTTRIINLLDEDGKYQTSFEVPEKMSDQEVYEAIGAMGVVYSTISEIEEAFNAFRFVECDTFFCTAAGRK